MGCYRAKQALYSTTDPLGPQAGEGVISVTPPASGFQVCGAGGVLAAGLARTLGLADSGLVEALDAGAVRAEQEACNQATHGAVAVGAAPLGETPSGATAPAGGRRRRSGRAG